MNTQYIFSHAIRVFFFLCHDRVRKRRRKSDLSLLLTSSFGVEAQYCRRTAPSIVSTGQNDCLVMSRRPQACQIEGTNVHRTVPGCNVVVTGYIQYVPFAVGILLRYKNSRITVAVWEIELLWRKRQTSKVIWKTYSNTLLFQTNIARGHYKKNVPTKKRIVSPSLFYHKRSNQYFSYNAPLFCVFFFLFLCPLFIKLIKIRNYRFFAIDIVTW